MQATGDNRSPPNVRGNGFDRDGTADRHPRGYHGGTYRALSKHGYANLTMQAIADEFEKTKAVLHYHYDTKDRLLAAFLGYILDRFMDRSDVADDDPDARLDVRDALEAEVLTNLRKEQNNS
ncbi:TetR/AcrR family transcriptional regulator [Halococcus sp. AFM35]|uniref:TetR/AcrR family transcriptional regulator n=1 Tax=Halococcus sp. AFM35 TaxID=3421653 RepID=UPI003EBC9DC0